MQQPILKQKDFIFPKAIISSNFQSGNLAAATMPDDNQINLWIGSDHNANYKTWFYFSVVGIQAGVTVTFTLMNMNNQVKLFKEGHQPVYKTETSDWRRIKIPMAANAVVKVQSGFQVTFKHCFTDDSKHYFAFSYPWTNSQNDSLVNSLIQKAKGEYFCNYQRLCFSYMKRSVMLLTLTKPQKGEQPSTKTISEGNDVITFEGKKGIFISARVHPGEVAASHMMNGVLKYLFSQNSDSHILLEKFVFYIVPVINPDGVAEGNFRTDSQGKNLNRFYTNPDPEGQPQIYGIKQFLSQMIKSNCIDFCLDLHAHVNKQGAFIYGNSIGDLKGQVDVCLFPKILSFHNAIFDYDSCNFSQKNMSSKDKGEELSKEGASRVAIYKQTGLPRCWTLQCNYNSSKIEHLLPKAVPENNSNNVSNVVLTGKVTPEEKQQTKLLNVEDFQKIGCDICESIVDYYHLRNISPIFGSKLRNMVNFRLNTAVAALRLMPFRFDGDCRKIINNINSNIQTKQSLERIKKMLIGKSTPVNFLEEKIHSKDNQKNSQSMNSQKKSYRISKNSSSKVQIGSKRSIGETSSIQNKKKISICRPPACKKSTNLPTSKIIALLK